MSEKKLHLESLRGIAALAVVLFHYSFGFMNRTLLQNGFTDNAALMVDFFFVLSGYVIALSYSNKLTDWSHVAKFQWKRFLRLYPLHLTMLLLFLSLQIAKYTAGRFGIGVQNELFEPLMSLPDFISNLFLTQNFTGDLSWNRPSWSISAEFYTYLLFATWTMIYVRMPRTGVALAILIVGLSAFQIYQTSMRSATGGYVRCFMSFFIGAALVKIERNYRVIPSEALSILVMMATVVYITMATGYPNWLLMLAPLLYSLLILLLNALPKSSMLIRALSLPALVFLGTVSYGIYMIHEFVESLALSIVNYVLKLPLIEVESATSRVLDLDPVTVTIIEIFLIYIVIYLANLSYKYIELPAMRVNRRAEADTLQSQILVS